MRTRAALLVVGLAVSAAAAADAEVGNFNRADQANQAPTAALYFSVPLGARAEQHARTTFGLRLQEAPLAPLSLGPWDPRQARTIVDVPFRARYADPLRESGALRLGTGAIVGIVVGAVVAVAVIADDGGGSGGGGY
jgi:hypothetical protein